jgi:hypothetical protein
MVLFSGNPVVNPGWLATNSSARAGVEPMLNAWASKLLGNGTKIRCTVERLDDTTGAAVETRTFPLSEVSVGALDMIYGVESASSATQADGSLSEVEQLVLYYAKHKTGGFDPQATIGCIMRGRALGGRRDDAVRHWNRYALRRFVQRAAPIRKIPSAGAHRRQHDDLVDLEARVLRGGTG